MATTVTHGSRPRLERTPSGTRADMPGLNTDPHTGAAQAGTAEPRVLVTLATYNEAGNLRALVESIRQNAPAASVLVIDDNSPDGTGALADELKAASPGV